MPIKYEAIQQGARLKRGQHLEEIGAGTPTKGEAPSCAFISALVPCPAWPCRVKGSTKKGSYLKKRGQIRKSTVVCQKVPNPLCLSDPGL